MNKIAEKPGVVPDWFRQEAEKTNWQKLVMERDTAADCAGQSSGPKISTAVMTQAPGSPKLNTFSAELAKRQDVNIVSRSRPVDSRLE